MSRTTPSGGPPSGRRPSARRGSTKPVPARGRRKPAVPAASRLPALRTPASTPLIAPERKTFARRLHAGVLKLKGGLGNTGLCPLGILVGLAAGWQLCGAHRLVLAALDALPTTTAMFASVVLLSAALGPWIPERIVLSASRFLRHRHMESSEMKDVDQTGTFWMLRAIRHRDPGTSWLTFAILASAAGTISLLTLASAATAVAIYQFLQEGFFWTQLTRALLEWGGVTLWLGLSWVLNGLLAATLLPVQLPWMAKDGRRSPGTASLWLGIGAAFWMFEIAANFGLSAVQAYLIGILPMFALAGMGASWSRRSDVAARPDPSADPVAPEQRGRGDWLIWLSLVVLGLAAAWIGGGFITCVRNVSGVTVAISPLALFFMLTGMGIVAAGIHLSGREQSASGCGMGLWAAGLGGGIIATTLAYVPIGGVLAPMQAVLAAVPIGYALGYTERAWLARAGSGALGFAQLLSALLGSLAVGIITGTWWLMPVVGAIGAVCVGALVLMAFGGLVQIYQQDRSVRVHQQRLALVFASLAGAISLFPANARRWLDIERRNVVGGAGHVDLDWLHLDTALTSHRVCLIGITPESLASLAHPPSAHVDILPMTPRGEPRLAWTGDSQRVRIASVEALRALRLERRRYDVVYQYTGNADPRDRFAAYSVEWFETLRGRLAPGGMIVLDVVLASWTPAALQVIAATFEHATGLPAEWTLTSGEGGPILRFRSSSAGVTNDAEQPGGWAPVAGLLEGAEHIGLHSLKRDRLTALLRTNTGTTVSGLLAWLESCRAR